MPAPFVWFDVTASSTDANRVRDFYTNLLGWTIGPDDTDGPYVGWVMDGDQPWAAVVAGDQGTAGRWIPFAQVDSLDAATKLAVELGATVVTEATDGPAGRAVTVADPGGALISLWVPVTG